MPAQATDRRRPSGGEAGGLLDGGVDRGGVGHVRAAEGRALAEARGRLRPRVLRDVGDQHVQALGREPLGARPPEAGGPARDDRAAAERPHARSASQANW